MKDGKFLEMLVECLQKTLATDGIVVSPDEKFYNAKGIQIAQVDIVIKGKVGSASVKIGIECRDRKEKQDRNWIQQINGKKQDLTRFKFTHWIAVSKYGFTSTAIELADENNIELLVPGEIISDDGKSPEIHQWMNFPIDYVDFAYSFRGAEIETDENCSKSQERKIIKKFQPLSSDIKVSINGNDFVEIYDFLHFEADKYKKNNLPERYAETSIKVKEFEFTNLKGRIDDSNFEIKTLKINIKFIQEFILPNFKLMFFTVPNTTEILGIIGVNEYQTSERGMLYLMVGLKPDGKSNPILLTRDSKGNNIFKEISCVTQINPLNPPTNFITLKINP